MGKRTAGQSAHSAVVHGGQIRFSEQLLSDSKKDVADRTDEDWEFVTVDKEESFEVLGGQFCRASTELSERYRCILQKNKRAVAWSFKVNMNDYLSTTVCVRIVAAEGCVLRVTARCWLGDNWPYAQKRMNDAFDKALTAFSARCDKTLKRNELVALAQRHTPADYALCRSSWVQRMGINSYCEEAHLNKAEQLLSLDAPHGARIARRISPAYLSARSGHRRSRRARQSTERLSGARDRADVARARGKERQLAADKKQRERNLFVDVPAIGRRCAPETVGSYGLA